MALRSISDSLSSACGKLRRLGIEAELVAFMTRALFGLRHNPAPDEADALAVGLTHLRRTAFSSRMVPAIS